MNAIQAQRADTMSAQGNALGQASQEYERHLPRPLAWADIGMARWAGTQRNRRRRFAAGGCCGIITAERDGYIERNFNDVP